LFPNPMIVRLYIMYMTSFLNKILFVLMDEIFVNLTYIS
jgi:hypothetical protein